MDGNGSSLRDGVQARLTGAGPISVRALAGGLKLSGPISCRDLINLLTPIDLKFTFDASGSCELTLVSNGLVRYQGKVHDSGAFAEKYSVATIIPAAIRLPPPLNEYEALILTHGGTLGGTLAFSSRDDAWDQSVTDAQIAANWKTLKENAQTATSGFFTATGVTEVVEALIAAVADAFAGAKAASAGTMLAYVLEV